MPTRLILINNGLVTSRDASMLGDGELTRADDCFYKPNNPALHKVNGRVAFNASAEASAILGTRYLEFETGTDLLVAMVGTSYRKAPAALTGAFSDLLTDTDGDQVGDAATITGGTTLDSVHYNNIHYLLNKVDRNRAVAFDGVAHFHGMLANTASPVITDDGILVGFTLSADSTMTYWVEERVKISDIIVRTNVSADTTTTGVLTGTGAALNPRITRPAVVNSDATHWALFATPTDGFYPVGAEIGEVVIGTTFIDDTRTGTDPLIPGGSIYETVSVTVAGTAQTTPRNGAPPIASTGDVFEDSLVLDDSTDRTRIRYSFPDEPDAFPAVNFIRFETKEADEVRLIRSIGRSVVVGLRDAMWRVDTLPRPEDSAFSIERVKEQVHGAHGAVGPMAGATFSFGFGLRLAYVSRYGLLVTDGFTWDVLTDDIDWEATVAVDQLQNSTLIDNPRLYRLEFDYTPLGETANSKALFLHYHPSHAKVGQAGNFRAKVTGPINRAAHSSVVGLVNEVAEVYTGNVDGRLYHEDDGNVDTSGAGGINIVVRTGDLFLSGISGESKIQRFYVHHQAGAAAQSATTKLTMRNSGVDDEEVTRSINLDRREVSGSLDIAGMGQAFQFAAENNDTLGRVAFDFFYVDFQALGKEQQG